MHRLLFIFSFLCLSYSSLSIDSITPLQLVDSARGLIQRRDYVNAKQCLKQAIATSEQGKDTSQLLSSLYELEKFHTEFGQNDSAIAICHRRLTINRQKRNYVSLSDNFRALYSLLLTNIGSKAAEGLMDSCLHYALLSKDNLAIAVAYTNYGMFLTNKDKQRGLEYLKAAITQSKNILDKTIYLYARVQTAEVLIGIDSLKKAKEYLQEALKKAIETNEKIQRTHVYLALGRISLKENRIKEAIAMLHCARIIAETEPYTYYLPDIYQNLAQAFRKNNSIDSCFYYSDRSTEVQQQLVNEKTNKQVAEVNAKYQLEGKESTIKKLGTRIGSYKKWLLVFGFGLFAIIAFFVLYLVRININKNDIGTPETNTSKGAKRVNPSLPEFFKNKFEEIFIKNEIYTHPDLTLLKLADLLNTNTTYLSRFINEEYKTNFSQLLNLYRIEKACVLLLSNKMDNLTIEAIAQAAGFNSKSTFNTAFRNQKGITPTQWREVSKTYNSTI